MTTTIARESIYDLGAQRDILDAWFSEAEGELTPELDALWTEWQGKFTDKVEATALYALELEARAQEIRDAELKLAVRRQALMNRSESLHRLLFTQMKQNDVPKVNGLLKTVAIQKNPPSVTPVVDLDDATLRNVVMYAPDCVTHVETWGLNKKGILAAHKAGTLDESVAKLVAITQSESIRIR